METHIWVKFQASKPEIMLKYISAQHSDFSSLFRTLIHNDR